MNIFRLALVSVLGLGMVLTTLPLSMKELKGATWDKAKRNAQCAFDFQDKHKCSKKEKIAGRNWVAIASAATVLTVAAAVGAGVAARQYYKTQETQAQGGATVAANPAGGQQKVNVTIEVFYDTHSSMNDDDDWDRPSRTKTITLQRPLGGFYTDTLLNDPEFIQAARDLVAEETEPTYNQTYKIKSMDGDTYFLAEDLGWLGSHINPQNKDTTKWKSKLPYAKFVR